MQHFPAGAIAGRPRFRRAIVAYASPIAVFAALTLIEPQLPAAQYPPFYLLKMLAVTGVLLRFPQPLADLRPSSRHLPLGIVVGLVVAGEWVLVETMVPYPHLDARLAFNPFLTIESDFQRWTFLAGRLCGLVLVVPLMEELFWRSFLLRYATRADFTSLPIGQFSASAFWTVVAISAAAHPEWLAAAIASALFTWLLRHTRNLVTVIVAHAAANATLGCYILAAGQWQFW
jgi:CAAX prenyl protease-like protein